MDDELAKAAVEYLMRIARALEEQSAAARQSDDLMLAVTAAAIKGYRRR